MTSPSDDGESLEEWFIIGPEGSTVFHGDIFAEMARQEDLANQRVTDAQRMIGTEGHHWWYRTDMPFLIMGHVPTLTETMAAERTYYGDPLEGEEAEEWEDQRRSLQERWDRGYRYGRAYSEVEPDGELGDTHISCMVECTEADFDAARRCHFQLGNLLAAATSGDAGVQAFLLKVMDGLGRTGEEGR